MKYLAMILSLFVLAGCEVPALTAPVGATSSVESTQPDKSKPKATPSPSPTVSPSPSPKAVSQKFDPFAALSEKIVFVMDPADPGFKVLGTLSLVFRSLGSYGAIQSATFVFNPKAPGAGGSNVGCISDRITLDDSDTNLHKLTIEQIRQHKNPQFNYAGSMVAVGAFTWDSWVYDSQSDCQYLDGYWELDVKSYYTAYHTMKRF